MNRSARLREGVRGIATRLRRGRVVLLYHRVSTAGHDPFRLNVSPGHFAEQLAVLRGRARLVHVAALADPATREALPRATAAITFDDGYADNLYAARPLLERADAPATVFVTTGSPGSEFWWDTLERILYGPATLPDELDLTIGGRRVRWKLSEFLTRRRRWLPIRVRVRGPRPAAHGLLRRLHPLLRDLEAEPRAEALARLAAWAGAADAAVAHRGMAAAEVQRLADGGLVEIGAHTVTHPMLSRRPVQVQAAEIGASRAWLEAALEREVRGFAYPFGQRGEYTTDTIRAVQDAGCRYACAAYPGFVESATSRWEVPRMWVEDWDGEEFARRLDAWLPRQ